jgi:hypothetical protein
VKVQCNTQSVAESSTPEPGGETTPPQQENGSPAQQQQQKRERTEEKQAKEKARKKEQQKKKALRAEQQQQNERDQLPLTPRGDHPGHQNGQVTVTSTMKNRRLESQLGSSSKQQQQPNGQKTVGEEDQLAFIQNTVGPAAEHPLPSTTMTPIQEQHPLHLLNLRLQRLALGFLQAERVSADGLKDFKLLSIRAEIPKLSETAAMRKRLFAEVERFELMLSGQHWANLEAACAQAIVEHDLKVQALRAQCDIELAHDPEFLGRSGLLFVNKRVSRMTNDDEHDDEEQIECDAEEYDEDDGGTWCEDVGGVWARDEDDGYDEAWAGE